MRILVTGCAGFIGSNTVDFFLNKGYDVLGIDNFSTGKKRFLKKAYQNSRFKFLCEDLSNKDSYIDFFEDVNTVIHLAANADVRDGLKHPTKDIKENLINTSNVLEAMRLKKVKNIIFSSTGSVYGEAKQIPTPEDCSFPVQTSLYGASKIAAEGLISSYCEGYGFNGIALRFVSLLGPRYTHGHVFDFVKSLKINKKVLKILGDGSQDKSYFHVSDCVNAIDYFASCMQSNLKGFHTINLGTSESIKVSESALLICQTLDLNPVFEYTGGRQGWIGDNPIIKLDISKANMLGWFPKFGIRESIQETTKWVNAYLDKENK